MYTATYSDLQLYSPLTGTPLAVLMRHVFCIVQVHICPHIWAVEEDSCWTVVGGVWW